MLTVGETTQEITVDSASESREKGPGAGFNRDGNNPPKMPNGKFGPGGNFSGTDMPESEP